MSGTMRDKSNDAQGFRFTWPFPKEPTYFYKLKTYLTMSFVKTVSKVMFLGGVNRLIVHNKEKLIQILEDPTKPLITVANHRCNIDDPLMWSIFTFREFWSFKDKYRYTLAAHNICFTKQFHTTIFSLGRCVPCVRGEGVYQQGMDFSVDMLNRNQWVHIFPEGKVCSPTDEPCRIKWGVGRLVADAETDPLILPVWCIGMNQVWPERPPYYPRFGNKVEVHIGEPFTLSHLKRKLLNTNGLSTEQIRKAITDEIQFRMYQLGEKVGDLPKGSAHRSMGS